MDRGEGMSLSVFLIPAAVALGLTNYHLPGPRMSLLIPVSVSNGADPDHVERALVEEATKAAGEVPGLLREPTPFVSLDFTLICPVATFVDQYLVQHELRKRILRRFRTERIEIPFPVRTVPGSDPGVSVARPLLPASPR